MAESKIELLIEKWRRRLCDWGMERPTQPTDGSPYLGGSAPLWENPAPKELTAAGIISFIISVTIAFVVVLVMFETDD